MPEIKPPIDPQPPKYNSGVAVIIADPEEPIQITFKELLRFKDTVRNNTLCEVLSVVTDKLQPGVNSVEKELTLVGVLKSVNSLRNPEEVTQ